MKLQPFFIGVCLLLANRSYSTTRYVDVNATNPTPPYTSWATASTDIQLAVNVAQFGDVVLVTNGVYRTGGGFSGSRVIVSSAITLQSVNGPTVTSIEGFQVPGTTNGNEALRCIYLSNNSAQLIGFTLTNGAVRISDDQGGAVKCLSNSVVSNCVITGNSAVIGGGAYSGRLINCVLTGNQAINGSVGSGGGANSSVLINCLVKENWASYVGGGLSSCWVTNCTITGNHSGAYGGGVHAGIMVNSILYNNTAFDFTNSHSEDNWLGGTFLYSCMTPMPTLPYNGFGNITNAPLFVDAASGNYHLQPGSPCINAGSNGLAAGTVDLDGNPRIMGQVDMGAYEFQSMMRFVNVSNASPVSPYTNWVSAATNIQDAVDVANAGELVVVNNGVYKTGGRVVYGAMTNRVVVDKAVTVLSANGPAVTLIQGNQVPVGTNGASAIRCVYLTEGAVLAGFTLTNGATCVLGDSTNEVSGGGVYSTGFGAVVSNCVLTVNAATRNGGGAFGGTLIGCTMVRNQAELDGGGAYASLINNSLIISNHAAAGGGAFYGTLNNCLVLTNSAGEGGGGFRADMNNCTVVGNSANGPGGGVYLAPYASITNCIVYYNTGVGSFSNYAQGYTSNSLSYCCTTPMPTVPSSGVGNFTNAPLFVNLAGGNFHLQSSSPCINAGLNLSVVRNKDFDGNPRNVGGTVDVGVYEFQAPTSVLCTRGCSSMDCRRMARRILRMGMEMAGVIGMSGERGPIRRTLRRCCGCWRRQRMLRASR